MDALFGGRFYWGFVIIQFYIFALNLCFYFPKTVILKFLSFYVLLIYVSKKYTRRIKKTPGNFIMYINLSFSLTECLVAYKRISVAARRRSTL